MFIYYRKNNDYKYNAESEIAHAWKEKIESCILPNNHKIIDLFEQNYFLITDREKEEFQIYKVHTKDFDYKGYTHHATPEDPQYEIKSHKTAHIAAHKGAALTSIKSKKD